MVMTPSEMLTLEQFLGILAFDMVHNDFDAPTIITSNSLRKRKLDDVDDDQNIDHVIKPNLFHPLWQSRKNKANNPNYRATAYCSVCHNKCYYYCATCSDATSCVQVCNPTGSNFMCFLNHQSTSSSSSTENRSKVSKVTPYYSKLK